MRTYRGGEILGKTVEMRLTSQTTSPGTGLSLLECSPKNPPQPSFVIDTTKTYKENSKLLTATESQFPTLDSGLSVPERVAAGDTWWGTMIGTVAGEPFACRNQLLCRIW